MKQLVIKFSLFTVIYIIFSWVIASDFVCALQGDIGCLQNVSVRYIVFMMLMVVYEIFVKKRLFKSNKK